MGFEAPLALLAVVLAGAPIAIHLMRRRDLRVVVLPTLSLLRDAQAESRQRLRVADLLLLLLRILALALLLGSVARPYSLTHTVANGDDAVALAIVLDDSASMGVRSADTNAFDAARTAVHLALDELPSGSEAMVLLAAAPVRVLVPRTSDTDAVRDALNRLAPSGGHADVITAVQRARRELSSASAHDLRILVLSDLRAGTVPEGGIPPPRGASLTVMPIAPRIGPNLALRDVLVTPSHEAADELLLQATVARTPTDVDPEPERAENPIPCRVVVTDGAGRELASAPTTLEGPVATVRLSLPQQSADAATRDRRVLVRLETDGDIFPGDDQRVVALDGRVAAHVGVVNGSPHRSPHMDEVTFLRAALDAIATSDLTLDITMLDAASIETSALDTLDVLVLANVATLTPQQGARLETFVRDGGSVLVTAGDQVQIASYAAALPNCLPGRLEPSSPAPVGAVVGEAPLASVPSSRVERRLPVGALELGASSLLRFSDGSPLLAGRALGQGRCAVLTTTVDLAWGELPLTPEFVALIEQTLRWLLGARRPTTAPRAGEPAELAIPSAPVSATVTTPEGEELPAPAGGVFTSTRAPGHYTVRLDGVVSERLSFTVGIDPLESDLRSSPYEGTPAEAERGAGAARRRSWVPTLLLLAALSLAAEGLLRTRLPRAV